MAKQPTETDKGPVWLALRVPCGCAIAVVVAEIPDVETHKADWLARGNSVLYATWADWRKTWMPTILTCQHRTLRTGRE